MPATAQRLDDALPFARTQRVKLAAAQSSEPVTAQRRSMKFASVSSRCRWLPGGRYLFLTGDSCRRVYIVVSGSFKIFASSPSGDEQIVGFFLPGDVLGLEAAICLTHRYSAIALEDAEVCELPLESFSCEIDNTQSHDSHTLLRQLCVDTIASNYAVMHSRSAKFAEQRLSSFLLNLWDKLDAAKQARGELSLTMSRRDIADYLGLAVGTISRTFSQLEQESLVNVRCKSVRMLQLDGLRRLASGERKLGAEHD